MKQWATRTLGVIAVIILGAGLLSAAAFDPQAKVSLAFDKTPIASVLRMLAAQNNLNLVVSSAVEENVSIRLENVSLRAALDAILLPNGYNYYIADDIIIVKAADQKVTGELTAQAYHLQYLPSTTAETAVKPLLSPDGKVISLSPSASPGSNQPGPEGSNLVVVDYPSVHETISRLLTQIDRKKRQVSVEVKFIENNLGNNEKLGINWPKSVSASINGIQMPSASTGDNAATASEAAILPLFDKGNWQFGYLSAHQVDIVLDFLQQRNKSKLLSNPRLTTLDNETAAIEATTIVPIQTINRFSEGAVIQDIVTFQDKEIGISLRVTPRINDDSTITMNVNPVVEEIIGYAGPTNNQKPITSQRSITTNVTVRNGETLVMGGLLKETIIEKQDKVFLLGSLPILGGLFTHRTKEAATTDLLILITPKILD